VKYGRRYNVTNLYPYQQDGVSFLTQRTRALLCDSPGLGKTAQAIVAAEKLEAQRILVVCPNVVKWQWEQEIQRWQEGCGNVEVCGQGREGVEEFLAGVSECYATWNVIHWSALRMLPDWFFGDRASWDILIADEVHYACNRKAQRTKALKRIKARYKWGLGATPYRNWIVDLWSVLNWLDRKSWTSYWRFFKRYLVYLDGEYGQDILGERNLDELADTLSTFVLSRTKAEVAQWLPPLTKTLIPIELPPAVRELYEQRRTETSILLESGREHFILNPLQRTTLLRQSTSTTRARAAADLFDTLQQPAVIFTYFKDCAEQVHLNVGPTSRIITGTTPEQERRQSLEHWRQLAAIGAPIALIMTLGVGGVGLSLDEADVLIFAGASWSSVEMEQALERIHRVTSTRPKHAYYIAAKDTLDDTVLWAVEEKADRRAFAMEALRHIMECVNG